MTDTPQQNGEEPSTRPSPNEELATEIVQALVEAGFIAESRRDRLGASMARGKTRQEDWKLWIEQTTFARDDHQTTASDAD
jgi:hypothetical protein